MRAAEDRQLGDSEVGRRTSGKRYESGGNELQQLRGRRRRRRKWGHTFAMVT
jgi:hypothetical protein